MGFFKKAINAGAAGLGTAVIARKLQGKSLIGKDIKGLFGGKKGPISFTPEQVGRAEGTDDLFAAARRVDEAAKRDVTGLSAAGLAASDLERLQTEREQDDLKRRLGASQTEGIERAQLTGGVGTGSAERLARSGAQREAEALTASSGLAAERQGGIRAADLAEQQGFKRQATLSAVQNLAVPTSIEARRGLFNVQQTNLARANAINAAAARDAAKKSKLGAIGSLAGTAVGAYFGGPVGASVGAGVGSSAAGLFG